MATETKALPALQKVHDSIWTLDTEQKLALGAHLPNRMTVVRLASGEIWLHSPVPLDNDVATALDALGRVAHIVAPNGYHHLHVRGAKGRYPAAQIWISPALEKKLADLDVTPLGAGISPPWASEIEPIAIEGVPSIGELVFFHRASRSLIVTDLLMNVRESKSVLGSWMLRMTGSYGKLAHSKLWRWMSKDRPRFEAARGRLLTLPIERIIMSHGEIVPHGGATALRSLFTDPAHAASTAAAEP